MRQIQFAQCDTELQRLIVLLADYFAISPFALLDETPEDLWALHDATQAMIAELTEGSKHV